MKCIELGVKKPKGILTIYGALALNYVTTPARYLGLMDVVLPYKVHMKMFGAYLGHDARFDKNIIKNGQIPKSNGKEFDIKFPNDPFLSPSCTPREILKHFPPTIVLSTNFDSCLDECVEFAKSLKQAGAPVTLDILKNLNHGFLNFSPVNTTTTAKHRNESDLRLFPQISREANAGSKFCMQRLVELLEAKWINACHKKFAFSIKFFYKNQDCFCGSTITQ